MSISQILKITTIDILSQNIYYFTNILCWKSLESRSSRETYVSSWIHKRNRIVFWRLPHLDSSRKNRKRKLRTFRAGHDYEPFFDINCHLSACRLRYPQRKLTWQLLKAEVPPKQILTSLCHNDPNRQAILRKIYDEHQNCRDEELIERMPIEMLLGELHQARWYSQVNIDDDNKLTHLFFVNLHSLNLLKSYSYTWLINFTYEVSQFNLPVAHIIRMTSFSNSFNVKFAFIILSQISLLEVQNIGRPVSLEISSIKLYSNKIPRPDWSYFNHL